MYEKKIQQSSFLITGGAGFIGSNLATRLVNLGARKVRVLDNLSTGYDKNLEGVKHASNFEFIKGDIVDAGTCAKACKGIDYIFHKAAQVSVVESVKNPEKTAAINIEGFKNILSAAEEAKIKRLIYASSAGVYGESSKKKISETDPCRPMSPYAKSKLENEKLAENFSKRTSIDSVGLRYFNVYGRRQDPSGAYSAVIPLFIKAFLEGTKITIISDGEQSRDFIYIDDAIDADLKACLIPFENESEILNIASGRATTINQLYQALVELSKTKPSVEYIEEREGEIKHSLADVRKAKRIINFQVKTSFGEGIKQTYDYYSNIYGA